MCLRIDLTLSCELYTCMNRKCLKHGVGVDWKALCKGKDMEVIPDMRTGCETCFFIPEGKEVPTFDSTKAHYKCDHLP
jgi:hypothetical protein